MNPVFLGFFWMKTEQFSNRHRQNCRCKQFRSRRVCEQILQSGKRTGFSVLIVIFGQKQTVTATPASFSWIAAEALTVFAMSCLSAAAYPGFGLMMVLGLMILLSKHIIKPFSENYEKQKRFITDAGHEIKTPITIINADTEVLEMDTGPNEWIDDIRIQTERLSKLTKDLIYLAKMEEGENQTQMIDFPLSEVISETAASFQALARTESKQLTLKIQPMLSFYGDENNIRRLTSILLDNALKYSDENGYIQLNLEKKGKYIRLLVVNTTRDALNREQLTHLFDRFYRMDTSRNSETGGYGIGLSIAQAVVQMHKGKISAAVVNDHKIQLSVLLPIRSGRTS